MSGQKRKSKSSPGEQVSISKFFKVSAGSPKKVPSLKVNDDISRSQKVKDTQKPKNIDNDENKPNGVSPNKVEKSNANFSQKIQKTKKTDEISENRRNDLSPNKVEEGVVDRGIMFAEVKEICKRKKVSFTPLEEQVVAIKTVNLDVLVFVECGYKYRFFGEDAEIAAKELNITAHLDHNFMTASIPVHRLTVHISRLVEKGYKVGVVKQIETAALKAAGNNKSAPFTRKLSQVYTKATFVDREEIEESDNTSDISTGRYIISISEVNEGSSQPYIGLVCVNPTSGDIACINYDVDENIASKLQTIFCALKPSEILLPVDSMDKKIEEYAVKYSEGDVARIERLQPKNISVTEQHLKDTLGDDLKCVGILACLCLMKRYLLQFDMQKLLLSLSNYRLYSIRRNCMKLDGSTIQNLELLENTFDGKAKGSLLWIIDHTDTVFGKRLLKRWLIQPLVNVTTINSRLDAVSELLDNFDSLGIKDIKKQFHNCLDIEKNLTSVYHRKISPDKFIKTLEHLEKLNAVLLKHSEEFDSNFSSSLLKSIFKKIPKFLKSKVTDVLSQLDKEEAAKGNKQKLFLNVDDYPLMKSSREKIVDFEEKLEGHKHDVKKILGGTIEYKTVSGNEYLIEVKNAMIAKVPKNWVKVNSTKQAGRFRPPFVEENFKKLCQAREELKIASDAAWEKFLKTFVDIYDICRKAVLKFAQLDCLLSLATVAKQPDHCRPVFVDNTDVIEITNGRHPVLSAMIAENEQYIGNDISLCNELKSMIVSGPNMGGKSTYIRQVAVNCILAQIGCYIPATSARLCPLDGIFTRMGGSDDIAKGKSTFMVELEQASMIIKDATAKSLVILDELGRGTSTYDGMAIAFATLKFFVEETKSFTLFVTHYPMLAEFEKLYPKNISNHHMAFMSASCDDELPEDGEAKGGIEDGEKCSTPAVDSIIFLYKLTRGAAKKSYGLNVARLAGIPNEILTKASSKSSQMETEVNQRMENVCSLKSLFCSSNPIATLKEMVTSC